MKNRDFKYKWILFWAILSLLFLIIIHFLFHWVGPEWIQAKWTAGEVLTYVSTVSLGLLALWQNQKVQERQLLNEEYNIAIDKYVLFTLSNPDIGFYNEKDNTYNMITGHTLDSGFNGNMAVWTTQLCHNPNIDSIKCEFEITNIGNYPATSIYICDRSFNRAKGTNVVFSNGKDNSKNFILPKNCGILYINLSFSDIHAQKSIDYYLTFSNPFGSRYYQKITFSDSCSSNILQINCDCNLSIFQ